MAILPDLFLWADDLFDADPISQATFEAGLSSCDWDANTLNGVLYMTTSRLAQLAACITTACDLNLLTDAEVVALTGDENRVICVGGEDRAYTDNQFAERFVAHSLDTPISFPNATPTRLAGYANVDVVGQGAYDNATGVYQVGLNGAYAIDAIFYGPNFQTAVRNLTLDAVVTRGGVVTTYRIGQLGTAGDSSTFFGVTGSTTLYLEAGDSIYFEGRQGNGAGATYQSGSINDPGRNYISVKKVG